MELSALSIVVNQSICEELKRLKQENAQLKRCIKFTYDDMDKRHNLYFNLVSLARSDTECSSYEKRIDNIKSDIGEKTFNEELSKLQSDEGEWTHGFNSGMLAALRLYGDLLQHEPPDFEQESEDDEEYTIEDVWKEAQEQFPFLDS